MTYRSAAAWWAWCGSPPAWAPRGTAGGLGGGAARWPRGAAFPPPECRDPDRPPGGGRRARRLRASRPPRHRSRRRSIWAGGGAVALAGLLYALALLTQAASRHDRGAAVSSSLS